MALSFASSELVALCLESILYGVYVVLFAECIKVLYHKRRRSAGGNYRLIAVSSVLFILITWHEVLDAVRLYHAYRGSQTDRAADLYYVNVTSMLSVMKTSVYLAETIVSDLFILFRCYIVWNASIAIVAFPILLYLADIGTGIAAVYTLTLIGQNVVFNKEQERVTNAFFSCTLALNAVCTGLIAFRIWWTQKQTQEAKMGSNLTQVSVIVVESGAIYLTVLACVVASFTVKSLLFNIFLDIASPDYHLFPWSSLTINFRPQTSPVIVSPRLSNLIVSISLNIRIHVLAPSSGRRRT
ncbi:hypothetical protein F5148DRAFT_985216 [Russula earlei]|uniref:Uncharacterized protein n=1 Tax=Russula earlei TaxID=71964 RepID=A0ACC0U020_9AGAM|nr:hypothetical protein F5148DRAFT_985216 [Russula earlei]